MADKYKTISGYGVGECYLDTKDEFITCVIGNKKLEGAWSVMFDGLKVGWVSPGISPTGNVVTFNDPSFKELGCYMDEDKIIHCSPKSRLESYLGRKVTD